MATKQAAWLFNSQIESQASSPTFQELRRLQRELRASEGNRAARINGYGAQVASLCESDQLPPYESYLRPSGTA